MYLSSVLPNNSGPVGISSCLKNETRGKYINIYLSVCRRADLGEDNSVLLFDSKSRTLPNDFGKKKQETKQEIY